MCNKIYNTADAGIENIENRKQAGAETKTKTTLCVVTIGISAPLAANCGTK